MAGFGLGPGVFNIITTFLMNPLNLQADVNINGDFYFPLAVSENFPSTVNWIIFIHLCVSITGLVFLCLPGQFEVKVEENIDETGTFTLMQAVKTRSFALISIMSILSLCSGYFIIFNFKTFGKGFINDDKYLAAVGSVGGLFDGTFRFVWGFVLDYTSFTIAYKLNLALQCLALSAVYWAASDKALYLICIAVLFSCKGGCYVLFTTLCDNVFGKQ